MTSKRKRVAGIILAAGKGSRMVGFEGNKTLLPLRPKASIYEGERPILIEVLRNLPPGPKGIVVGHFADDVKKASAHVEEISYIPQPVTNGTGGALLAAASFIESSSEDSVVITMGDVPLILRETYESLIHRLEDCDLALLAFTPADRAQYGMIEMEGDRVLRIVEWKYWREYPPSRQATLKYCNAGVYAAKRDVLVAYLGLLSKKPHQVRKQRGEEWVVIEEYFLTDLVELMSADGRSIGLVVVPEEEVSGVDTPEALKQAQERFERKNSAEC